MKRFIGLTAVLSAIVLLAACGKTETHTGHTEGEAPHAAAPAPAAPPPAAPTPAPAAMTMPMHGGQMVASGNFNAEIEASAEEVEAYFYDAQGKPITGSGATNVMLQISMADGHRAKAELKVHDTHYTTGEVLAKMGVHAPYDGAITAVINGQQAQFRFTAAGGGEHSEAGGEKHH
jgi:hypothetical protein